MFFTKEDRQILAIDIGTNAMRATVGNYDQGGDIEILESVRYAIRLGEDVFKKGSVGKKKIQILQNCFRDLMEHLENYQFLEVNAVATSALRNAKNQQDVLKAIKDVSNIDVKVIDGKLEAEIIKKAVDMIIPLSNKKAFMIDIGGGSTEINITDNRELLFSKSYPYGTIRFLENQKKKSLEKTLSSFIQEVQLDLEESKIKTDFDMAIGTGGNLRRMGKLRKKFFNRTHLKITHSELAHIYDEIIELSLEQRERFLDMRKDRADVIVPAMAIVDKMLESFNLTDILLPQVGLKEGLLIQHLDGRPRCFLLD